MQMQTGQEMWILAGRHQAMSFNLELHSSTVTIMIFVQAENNPL